jgi:formylmethanofuran dehydrogenase subunit A
MPGGIDMHCHIAGPKVNAARKMRPEEKRHGEVMPRTAITHSGTLGSVPSTFATGYKYIGTGIHDRLRRRGSSAGRAARA